MKYINLQIGLFILCLTLILTSCTMGNNKKNIEKMEGKTKSDFGIRASNLFLYYKDLDKAADFYSKTLGLEMVADYEMARIFRMSVDSYLILVDATKGMHTAEEPKTVALALLTDQLDEWYTYLKEKKVDIKYDYKPKEGSPHDGFVIYDSEGYLLEFERFNKHPENKKFIPLLDQNSTLKAPPYEENTVPEGLGFKSTITWLYYKDIEAMQEFFEDVLGLEFIVDQGWAKIYQVSRYGFIGLVDEKKGMHTYTQEKAVNVSFIVDNLEAWFEYVKKNKAFELRSDQLEIGPEKKYIAFVGYDPEGYYLEFDKFYPHDDNALLINYLHPGLD